MSHILLNYAFLLFWSILGEIHWQLFFLDIKVTIAETSPEILRIFVFLSIFWKGQILRKIWICINNCFDQTSKRWQILTKTVFLPILSQIQLNYAFLLFWSINGENHRELFFLVKMWLSQKSALKYSENLIFLPCLKGVNPEENSDLFKQLFLNKPVKGD